MARKNNKHGLDSPLGRGNLFSRGFQPSTDDDRFGKFSESFARAMGTSGFLVGMTIVVTIWLVWNTFAPREWQFDPAETNFTLMTLVLSLQASYAAPLILLAQNRQDDRDRVQIEQDRQRAERNLADTEYLARELTALRIVVSELSEDLVTRQALRDELAEALKKIDSSSSDSTRDRKS